MVLVVATNTTMSLSYPIPLRKFQVSKLESSIVRNPTKSANNGYTYEIYSPRDCTINSNTSVLFKLDLRCEIPTHTILSFKAVDDLVLNHNIEISACVSSLVDK